MISYDFKDQVVIVTGGTRGIGAAITKAFLEANAKVVATYLNNDQKAREFQLSLDEQRRGQLFLRKFDVSNKDDVSSFYNYVNENFPKVHILINNAGLRKDAVCALMKDEEWQQVLDINLTGTFLMSRGIIPLFMKNRYGRIINMSSIGAILALQGQCNYSASKAAQISLAKCLAKELAKKGITVNSICPGFIETELLEGLSQEQLNEYKKQIPMKRIGTTQEVADAVLFLSSKNASYITGASIEITGGLHS